MHADCHGRTDIRYHSGPGGFCNVAEVEFYASSVWGWLMVALILGGGGGYVVAGGFYGQRLKGGAGGGGVAALLAAHPHYTRWIEVAGLCEDGVAFARGGRPGYRSAPTVAGREAHVGEKRSRSPGDKESLRKTSGGHSKKEKKEKKEKKDTKEAKGGGNAEPAAGRDSAPSSSAATPSVAGTRAGDGGRWVHVPN